MARKPKAPDVSVTPYLYGDHLYLSVEVDGVEYEFEEKLATLFKVTAETIDPYDLEQEQEALTLIFALEDGTRQINDALGADEQEFEDEQQH
jgi:hypothetical protein